MAGKTVPRIPEIGERFGRWTVGPLATGTRNAANTKCWCVCDCGHRTTVYVRYLFGGQSKSCGCGSRRRRPHGNREYSTPVSGKPEYAIWCAMINRCHNQRNTGWQDYGGRGISVCDKWKSSFEAFFTDVGPRPSNKHSIDRINNDGNYEPGNVRWATHTDQMRNRRGVHRLTYCGVTKTLPEWSEMFGIPGSTLRSRVNGGYSAFEALCRPYNQNLARHKNKLQGGPQ